MITLNQINRKLKTLNTNLVDAYNRAASQPIPAGYIRQNLTLVGLKEGYRFEGQDNGTLLTLTQDVNKDFEPRELQDDKQQLTNTNKAALVFGTSQALHDRPFNELSNGATQSNNSYDYAGIQASDLDVVTFELNGDATGYNPSFDESTTSEPMGTHLSYLCGVTLNGDYPYRYITSGAPVSLYNLATSIQGKEGPLGSFEGVAKARLQAQGYDPVGGIEFNDVNLFAQVVSPLTFGGQS